MDQKLRELIDLWKKWDKNEKTRTEIDQLVKEAKWKQLSEKLVGRITFGTAGMRGAMCAGFNKFNDLTIIQTAQGMVKYMKSMFSAEALLYQGIVIGYDARHNSERFAKLTANIFLRNSCKVNLFSKIVPTPFVSYAVTKLKCLAGVMVTASHNPKGDNGFKVYWSNGAQILAPHDSGICKSISENLEPWPTSWEISEKFFLSCPLHIDPHKEIRDEYMLSAGRLNFHKESNSKCSLKFTYTPVHGVGYFYTPLLLKAFGFSEDSIVHVQSQMYPDPDFPTAPFPNPEEGEPVLQPAFEAAEKHNSTIILANDPDADRFQLAERQPDDTWRVFTGNEIGGLMAWWLWTCWKQQYPDKPASTVYMLNSVVSSHIVRSIANAEGFCYEETLTGFKWMANRAQELREAGATVLLCWEESIGYMPNGPAVDKDGVLSAAIFAEFASFLHLQNRTFSQQLEVMNQKYGSHLSSNSYYVCYDLSTTKRIFDRLRNFSGSQTYPEKCGPYNVKYVRDLTVGFDSSQPNNKPILPVSSSSQMITFTLEDSSVLTLRASGTEPKIKYYIEIVCDNTSAGDLSEQLETLRQAVDEFLQPRANNLVRKI